ncbi:hypothetical protein POM88_008582 [Heracleum sosnowskyi]|uniref:Uncharacterized protein n=1 Tax=Heracleum sosnowskyi TaxID=360622 RepID=A0AAD8N6M9_9APIA|nr:hypothetical protein POM88_008582 [Heracleum sosnowskyi]
MHLVKWNKVCLPKKLGGLGFSSIEAKNEAMLSKWWWKWIKDRDKLWRKVLADKYSLNSYQGLEQVENNFGMSEVMKGILALSSNQAQRDLLHFENYSWVVGNGRDLPPYKEMWTRELGEWEKPISLELYELILNIRCNHKEDEDIQSHSKSLKGILALVRGYNLKQAWEIVVSSTFWTLWLARNEHIFKGT